MKMQQSNIRPWISLLLAAFAFGIAYIGGSFFVAGVVNQAAVVPVKNQIQRYPSHGPLTASRINHPYLYFGSLTFWAVESVAAGVVGIIICFQAAFDYKCQRAGKVFQPRPRWKPPAICK